MGRHQILGLLCFLFFLHSSLPLASPLCPLDQRDALLQFKDPFALDGEASSRFCDGYAGFTSYPKTNSWSKGIDCCLWDGVTCDGVTGNVIRLDLSCSWLRGTLYPNSSLFILPHIRSLNLAYNDFLSSDIWPNLSAFSEMTHLNLSGSYLSGTVPSEISHLSKLVSLDLSKNSFFVSHPFSLSSLRLENSIFSMLVQNLTTIKNLVLDEVDMSMVSPMFFVNLSSSLKHLRVDHCSIGGIFLDSVFRLPSLITLDLRLNFDLSGILPKSNWTGPLVFLDLESTSFSGELPNSIGNMKSLAVLNLLGCKFTGLVPSSVADLKQLKVLDLRLNDFSGVLGLGISTKAKVKYTFPKLEQLGLSSVNLTEFPYFLNSSKKLNFLDLSSNRISGEIPRWFWGISDALEFLVLSDNLLEGGIQQLHLMKRLSYIDLQNNSFQQFPILPPSTSLFFASTNGFTGEIPSSICQLSSLHTLQLSNNSFSGNIPPCFGNITSLVALDLSKNKLQGPLPRSLVNCSSLSVLHLSHNEFTDIFPHWLQAPLGSLDLGSNKFHGGINVTFLGLSFPALESLFISNNNFVGQWSTQVFSNTSLAMIDLSNNKFEGPIPLPSPVTYYYSIANNNMMGKIPSLLCNATELLIIDLSNNSLTGSLPWCLTSFSTDLSALQLRKNYLEGTIPQSFSYGNSLKTLDLSQNQFEGTLPRSLVKCKNLEVLDLSGNRIEDTFPRWLGTLPELKVLSLKSNNFKDLLSIPKGTHLFPKLRILDLSNNNFDGPLPASLIMNLKGMMNGENNGQDSSLYMTWYSRTMPYENSVTMTIKGQEIELAKILSILRVIDLSCNSFQGDIPKVIGHLHSLIGLNLSHNHLIGSIPPTLGNLTDLGWLDLSSNKLSGEIPRVLGDLASLGYLNLSKNQLTGRIPQDKHLSTFSNDSFSGNPDLCGTPLMKACPGDDAQPPPPSSSSTSNCKGHERWSTQKATWIGYASGIVIGISIAYIAFEMGRPKWLTRGVRMLERRAVEWMEKPKRKAIK